MSTTQDYQAAEQLLRRPARPGELVIGDKVRPQWIDGDTRFLYAVSNGAGRRFVLVEPAAGARLRRGPRRGPRRRTVGYASTDPTGSSS